MKLLPFKPFAEREKKCYCNRKLPILLLITEQKNNHKWIKKRHKSQRLVNFHNNYMTFEDPSLSKNEIERREKKVYKSMITITPLQVKLLPLPSQSWGTHKLPYPLSPSALDAWSGIKDRSPLSLWSPWGYHNISPVSVSLLCCLNSSCSCVSLSDRRWIMELNAK